MDLPILRPPFSKLARRLESQVRKALYDYNMLQNVDKLGVALSGGKDSLTLLYLLKAISGRGFPEVDLYAIHVTGKFSCGSGVDIQSLQTICDKLEIPLLIREAQQEQDPDSLECYSCSRQRRRLIFEAAHSVGASHVAFGHHRDDNIQTLLLNLLHKGEFAGTLAKLFLCDYDITILRPLIYIAEADIRRLAEQHHFARAVCRCPVGQRSMRRKVDQLLTDIELLFPHARDNLSRGCLKYGSRKAERL